MRNRKQTYVEENRAGNQLHSGENRSENKLYTEDDWSENKLSFEENQAENRLYAKGNRIGNRFVIHGQLAKGGMSRIYLAGDLHLGRNVIVKISSEQELLQEAELLGEIKHPAFPSILDLYRNEKEIMLVMEYIDGLTLREYIEQKGPFSEQQTMQIGLQILDALIYLHDRRPALVYQDLKPENIMLQGDGTVRLIDLGAAVQHLYDGSRIVSMGTKGYAAPEQEKGNGNEIDTQSDIYALGAVLYSMVTGIFLNKPPYTMDPVEQVCPELSDKLLYIIERSTEKEKGKRFGSAREIEQIWKKSDNVKRKYRRKTSLPYLRRETSLFLTAKKHSGLWMCFLGVILGATLLSCKISMQGQCCVAGVTSAARSIVHQTKEVVYLDICESRCYLK